MGDSPVPLAASNGGGAVKSLSVSFPQAGIWWIAVHNPISGRLADPFTLHYGVVSAAPDRTDGSPFGLTFDWNLPGTVSGDHWYGAVKLGTSAAPRNFPMAPAVKFR